jgi:glycosyltransferase involved in cell wall biosynthesis
MDFLSLKDLFILFKENHFDAIVTVAPKAGLLAMLVGALYRIPVRVHIFQGEPWASMSGFKRFFFKSLDTLTAFLSTSVLAVSPSEREFLISESVVNSSQVTVLGSGSIGGVDLKRFRMNPDVRRTVRQEYQIPLDAVVIIFIGRLNPDKGMQELFRAFDLVVKLRANTFLMIVGPNESAGQSLDLPLDSINRIRSVGFTLTPENFLMAADFLCLPSYREGFPVCILEASAVGIPSIGTRIYGVIDSIVEGETGVMIQPGNVDELVAAILEMIDDSSRRLAMGVAANQRVVNGFSSRDVVERYVMHIRDLLS